MSLADEMQDFARLIQAVDPWLGQLVIIGGWAHRLHRLHPLAQKLDYPPLLTLETDVAVPQCMPAAEGSIAQRLREYGFIEALLGDHQPPVTRYRLGSEESGFYAEFLTPLTGSRYKRDGTPDATVRVAGVSSQKLRYLDVLLQQPWAIDLDKSSGFPSDNPSKVRIPNAATFIAQKLLIQEERERKQRGKEMLYIHDTIETFGDSLDTLRAMWREDLKPRVHANVVGETERTASEMFSKLTDPIRDASEIAQSVGRDVQPDDIRRVCHAGVQAVFL